MIKNKSNFAVNTVFLSLIVILNLQQAFAADFSESAEENVAKEKSGVFIFSADENKLSSNDLSQILIENGLDKASIRVYVENESFGFKEFQQEVIKNSSNLSSVLMLFHFHGADDGGCAGCNADIMCMQGNLRAENKKYISAQNIVDDFITPFEGKKIVLFFRACFSGHLAKKVEQIASKKTWLSPTPIALVATDNNKPTSSIYFPDPDYSRKRSKFQHWDNIKLASMYEKMTNFSDYVQFINSCSYFTFTFSSLNNGEAIELTQFGFKDPKIKPLQELEQKNEMYKNIKKKLQAVDLSNLIVLFTETAREYENLAHGDMWLNAFLRNGVPKKNIHWIKAKKADADQDNPQIHGFFDNFDFITPKHNVLLFIRGDDASSKPNPIFPHKWDIVFGKDKLLKAQDISTVLLPNLNIASRVLVLICSTYADIGFEELVPLVKKGDANVAIVSFFSPVRKFHLTTLFGWPMGFLAPYYSGNFLFYMDGKFRNAFPKVARNRELALAGFSLFEKLTSFDDYLEFLQKAEHSFIPKEIAIKTYNIARDDLKGFGFLPSTSPESWFLW